jgi:hypothetical protein
MLSKGTRGVHVEALIVLRLEFPVNDTLRCPFFHVLGLVCVCVFVFGENIDDVAGWVVSVIGIEVHRIDVYWVVGGGVLSVASPFHMGKERRGG